MDVVVNEGIRTLAFMAKEPFRPSFLLDVHLGKLAKYLRILGFDILYKNDFADAEIVDRARKDGRIILTRDRGLLKRKAVVLGYLVQNTDPKRQITEIIEVFRLSRKIKPYRICSACGGALSAVEKSAVDSVLPPRVARRYRRFYRCPSCGKVYWKGDHFKNLEPFVRAMRRWGAADPARKIFNPQISENIVY